MFEHVPNYPMAVTVASGPDQTAFQLAVDWLRNITAEVGGQPLVYAPTRDTIRELPILAQLDGWAVVTTWKMFSGGWSGGAVLAAWPDAGHLAVVADDRQTRALCVVPWGESEVAAWVRAYRPVTLPATLAVATTEPEMISDPVVVEGLKTLTGLLNVTSLYASVGGRDRAVTVLRTLHDGGHAVDPEGMRAWAMAHGWSASAAGQLAELAKQIAAGKQLRITRRVLRSDILDVWRKGVPGPVSRRDPSRPQFDDSRDW